MRAEESAENDSVTIEKSYHTPKLEHLVMELTPEEAEALIFSVVELMSRRSRK